MKSKYLIITLISVITQSCFIPDVPPTTIMGEFELIETVTNGNRVASIIDKRITVIYPSGQTAPGYHIISETLGDSLMTEKRSYNQINDRKMKKNNIIIYEFEDGTFRKFVQDFSPKKSEIIVYELTDSVEKVNTNTYEIYAASE